MFGLNNIVNLPAKAGRKLKKTFTNTKGKYTPRKLNRAPSLYPHVSGTLSKRSMAVSHNIPYTEDGHPDLDKMHLNYHLNFFEWDARIKAGSETLDDAFKEHEWKKPIVFKELKRRADLYREYADNFMKYQAVTEQQPTYSGYSKSETVRITEPFGETWTDQLEQDMEHLQLGEKYETVLAELDNVINSEPGLDEATGGVHNTTASHAEASKAPNAKADNARKEKTLTSPESEDHLKSPVQAKLPNVSRGVQPIAAKTQSLKISRPPRIATCHQTI